MIFQHVSLLLFLFGADQRSQASRLAWRALRDLQWRRLFRDAQSGAKKRLEDGNCVWTALEILLEGGVPKQQLNCVLTNLASWCSKLIRVLVMVQYGTIWYNMVQYGTIWYHIMANKQRITSNNYEGHQVSGLNGCFTGLVYTHIIFR